MDLSVIILSYNTATLTVQCVSSLVGQLKDCKLQTEIIVIDNASKDDSVDVLKKLVREIKEKNVSVNLQVNDKNLGFPGGNNQGIHMAKGKYVLFLNSDVIVQKVDFDKLVTYLDEHIGVGGMAIKLLLPTGGIDPASHRGFPTPWNAFCYFSKLEKLGGKLPYIGRVVGGYHMTYLPLNTIHEIDAPNAAFFLTRKELLDTLNGFDEEFFMYGEDLDLTYRMKKIGYKIIYDPHYTALHMKYSSGLKGKNPAVRKRTRKQFYDAMKLFYKKHYEKKYPKIIQSLVFAGVDIRQRLFG